MLCTYLAGCDLNHTGTYLNYYYHVRATYLHIENIHTIRYLHIFWVHSQGARITKASHFDYEYVLGHKIVFICVATGKPRPKIVWFKDGRELYDHHYLHISEWYKGKRRLKSKMEIDPATQGDAGIYECHANNKWSVDMRSFRTDYNIFFD